MESPTRLSQSRFFRFGRLSKASRKSTSGYSNHSFSHPLEVANSGGGSSAGLRAPSVDHHQVAQQPGQLLLHHHHQGAESSYAGSDIIYQQLNHRSASMSTLPSSMPPGMYTPLPYGENFGLNQPRLSQLQTLEAKMASIASSLSGSGGGRRSAAGSIVAGSLPYHQQQHHSSQTIHHGGSLRNSASVDVDKTVISSGKASSSHGGTSSTSRSKQIRNEIELLRKIIKDKDALIQTLQQRQEQQQQQSNMSSGMAPTTTINGGVSRATSNERQQIERRLALLNRDIELKRAAIKNIRLSLHQTNVSDNIDSRIRQAETEYQLEREETNLLNLQDEKRTLLLRFGGSMHQWTNNNRNSSSSISNNNGNMDGHHNGIGSFATSLFRILQGRVPLVIVINHIDYDGQNPSFKLHYQNNQHDNKEGSNSLLSSSSMLLDTCTVQWAREDLNLKPGDKVLEINGQLIPELEKLEVTKLLITGSMEIVVGRPSQEETFLGQIQELSTKVERLIQERDGLKGENLRLKHRISYLEEVRHDENLLDQPTQEAESHHRKHKSSNQLQHDSLSSTESSQQSSSLGRDVQSTQVRQKPPRTSKMSKTADVTLGSISSSTGDINILNKRSTQAERRSPSPPSTDQTVGRIKTSSIVDRHFGHVIRVTHHHHPQGVATPTATSSPTSSASHHGDYPVSSSFHRQRTQRPVGLDSTSVSDLQSVASYDSFVDVRPVRGQPSSDVLDNGAPLISKRFYQRSPPSPTRSEVQSVASMDLERHHHRHHLHPHNYTAGDDHSINSSITNYSGIFSGGSISSSSKKQKPVPPRKPSFLYLNRASSLQSVNGVAPPALSSISGKNTGTVHSMDRSLSSHNSNKSSSKSSIQEESWNNNTAPSKTSSLRSALSGNLKWNILSSSSSRSKNASKDRDSSRD